MSPLFFLLLGVVLGCGDNNSPEGPADSDAAIVFDATATEAPTLPAPPEMRCPDGWTAVGAADPPEACDPWPAGSMEPCTGPQAHFPGTPGCAAVGAPCPADGWPAALPASAVLYVRAGAAAGDGSRASPFGTIREALTAATTGTTVAIAVGRYDEVLRPGTGVSLVGACAVETVLTSSDANEVAGVVHVQRRDVAVSDVRIDRPQRPGVVVEPSGTATVERVVIERPSTVGIAAGPGASIVAREVIVRDVQQRPSDGVLGHGVDAFGATVTVERAVIERTIGIAFASGGGGELSATDTAIVTVAPSMVLLEDPGLGLWVSGGSAMGDRLVIEDSKTNALSAQDAATLRFGDVVLRHTRPSPAGLGGRGVEIFGSVAAQLDRTWIADSRDIGIAVFTVGTDVRASDVRIEDTTPAPMGQAGYGFALALGGALDLHRAAIARSTDLGGLVHSVGSVLTMEDIQIADTVENPVVGDGGRGLHVQSAQVTASRVLITNNTDLGIEAQVAGTVIDVSDLTIRGTGMTATGFGGFAFDASVGARATIERALFDGNRTVGLMASAGEIDASFVSIVDTQPADCGPDGCLSGGYGGIGAAASNGGRLALRDFSIRRSALCGVYVFPDADVDLVRGEVSDSTIGACIATDGYDVARLSDSVGYRDNDVNLETRDLPVPETSTPRIEP